MWPRFAALLLILLSVFYMPAALDPTRYRTVAWLAVGSRLAGVLFFLDAAGRVPHARRFDLVFFVPEAILLALAVRSEHHGDAGRRRRRAHADAAGGSLHAMGALAWTQPRSRRSRAG